jgi:hypothetical protein
MSRSTQRSTSAGSGDDRVSLLLLLLLLLPPVPSIVLLPSVK